MPKYCYYCENCKTEFEISHSIKERLENCTFCASDNTLKKLISMPTILTQDKPLKGKKVGSLVEEYIEKNKQQLQQEKDRLKKVEY